MSNPTPKTIKKTHQVLQQVRTNGNKQHNNTQKTGSTVQGMG